MNSEFICDACNKEFAHKKNLVLHYAKCDVAKYIKANLNKNENKENEILQFKLDEANKIIEDDKIKFDEFNKIINEKQISINALQMRLEFTDKIVDEKNNIIEDKNKIIEDKNEEIKDFRRYYDYFMTGNSNTMKDLCSIIKLDREPHNTVNNNSVVPNVNTNANASSNNSADTNTNHSNNATNAQNTTHAHNNNNNSVTMVLNNYAPSAIQPIDQLIDIKETLNQYINLF